MGRKSSLLVLFLWYNLGLTFIQFVKCTPSIYGELPEKERALLKFPREPLLFLARGSCAGRPPFPALARVEKEDNYPSLSLTAI